MGMGVADAVMAGRVGAVDLAGVTLGGNVYWPASMLAAGMIMAVTPSVSQLHGAGRQAEAGEVVRQAVWIALVGGILMVVFMNTIEPLYYWIGIDPLAIPIAVAYLHALSFSVIQLMLFFCLRYLCEGLSWTQPAMIIAMLALGIKIYLNDLFIHGGTFGPWTVPRMGGVGCGWATAVVINFQLFAMALVVAFSRAKVAGFYARFSWPRLAEIRRLVRLGLPIGLTTSLEMAVFSGATLVAGTIGVQAVAAHQIAMNVGGLTFMLPLAIGMGAAIRVGFNVGAGDLDAARRSGWVAICVASSFALLAGVVVFLGRDFIASLYSKEAAVVGLAAQLMLFVAFFQLFDASQTTGIGALRGYKDTRTPMLVAMVAYWVIGFPVACLLCFGWLGAPELGLWGIWTGLTLGLGVAAFALIARYHWLSRQPARVLQLAAH